jgi:transposase
MGANEQLSDALCDFAGDSRHDNPWAANLHARAIARGHDHPHAVRILARAWAHISWRCWHDNVGYDTTKHAALQALLNRTGQAA